MLEQLKPELRFPEFDGDWTTKSLGNPEVATFFKGKGISKNDIVEDGETPCIRYGELYTEYNEVIDEVKSSTDVPEDELVLSEEFDVIIPASGETVIDIATASCVLKSDIALGGDLNIIRPNTLNGVFLAYYLNNAKKRNIARLAQGISVIHLYKNHLKSLSLNIPEPDEQQKIANFLKAIDKRIKLLKAKKVALEEYKTSIMQKLFSQEIRFKQEDGSDFPEWKYPKLGLKCKIQNGYAFKSSDFESDGYPIIRISNISNDDNYIDSRNMVRYNRNDIDRKFEINSGDLLIAMSGATTGKVSIFNLNEKAFLNQRVGLFRLIENGLSYGYLTQYVFSRLFRADIFKLFVEGSQPNISGKDIENFNMPLPHPDEQVKIDSMLSGIDFKIDDINNKIGNLIEYKAALLQKMFV